MALLIESLGWRGTNDLPYGFTVLQAVANLAIGRNWKHPFAQSLVTLNQVVQPASLLYSIFALPLVDFVKTRKHVGVWIKDIQQHADKKKTLADGVKASIFFFAYIWNVSKAAQQVISLGVWNASEPMQMLLSKTTLVSSTLFASLALLGTGLNTVLTAYKCVNLSSSATGDERKRAYVELKHASLNLIRIVAKVGVVVGVSYLSLTAQALITLTIVGTEIYLKRHRYELKQPLVSQV